MSFVKCPFCLDRVLENILVLHFKKAHKSEIPLIFMVHSVGQKLPCAVVDSTFSCPFAQSTDCRFFGQDAGEILHHVQKEHDNLPAYFKKTGFINYPDDFLEREECEIRPSSSSGSPNSSNLVLGLPPVAPHGHSYSDLNQIVVDLELVPKQFEEYVAGRNPKLPVTSTDVLSFVLSLRMAQGSLAGHRPAHRPLHDMHTPTANKATRFKPYPPSSLHVQRRSESSSAYPRNFSSPIEDISSPLRGRSSPIEQEMSSPIRYPSSPVSGDSLLDPFLAPHTKVPSSIYNPMYANDDQRSYVTSQGSISYRNLVADQAIRITRISLDKIRGYRFGEVEGPKAVWQKLGSVQDDFTGFCIYHAALNLPEQCESNTYHCSGPLGSKTSDYYLKYRPTVVLPRGTCFGCWTPIGSAAKAHFHHPPNENGHNCTGRQGYEDLYRGLPYILFRCSALRRALFSWLGSSEICDKFHSTTDWARWIQQPTSKQFVDLTNYLTLVWAYTEMFIEGSLPKTVMAFDDPENDPPLFSAPQRLS